ncbi:MAG: signal transduction histidine kinase, partial [Limisphaerales bacterium]
NAFENTVAARDCSIEINLTREKNFVNLTFFDNGKGIPKPNLNSIFEPFYTNSPITGTGIGLAFVKSVVEQRFAGRITCTSEPGEFTLFAIQFAREN